MSGDPRPFGVDDRVLYACYGSNLAAGRLRRYLEGGVPPGGTLAQPGARDPAPPRRSLPVELAGQVWFGGRSVQWGGAVAFFDPDVATTAPGRAWDLSTGQLADVVAQENGRAPGRELDVAAVVAAGRLEVDDRWYGSVVHLGHVDDLPLLTCTSPGPTGHLPTAPPSAAYARVVATGLEEAHDWDARAAARYLLTCPGVAPGWDEATLVAALLGGPDGAQTR